MAASKKAGSDAADLPALEAARRIAAGELSSVELVSACLQRIAAGEERIGAWAFLDKDKAMAQAEMCDRRRAGGLPLGPLHGVPVGIKDIIDVEGMPTGNGSPIDADRRPLADATVVRRLRHAGAVILGKTVTTEFAYFHPGKTRNPHDSERTPGGSSSGSAAAVASAMVPLALGSQTNGSMIRPASFCGVVGFKPSFGAMPRTGVLPVAKSLDHVGIYARTIEDIALAEHLMGPDGSDGDARTDPGPLIATAMSEPPVAPDLCFVGTPFWERAEPGTQSAFGELCEVLGDRVEESGLPDPFANAAGWLGAVMAGEMARNLGHYVDDHPDQTSAKLKDIVAQGRKLSAPDYLAARDMRQVLRDTLEPIFGRFDAIVTPAAPGEAPMGLESTGDPIFCTLWTFCGLPAISLPLLTGPNGLPLGVQLVGAPGNDARLLRTARWLVKQLQEDETA